MLRVPGLELGEVVVRRILQHFSEIRGSSSKSRPRSPRIKCTQQHRLDLKMCSFSAVLQCDLVSIYLFKPSSFGVAENALLMTVCRYKHIFRFQLVFFPVGCQATHVCHRHCLSLSIYPLSYLLVAQRLGNHSVNSPESHTCVAGVWGMMPGSDPFAELQKQFPLHITKIILLAILYLKRTFL